MIGFFPKPRGWSWNGCYAATSPGGSASSTCPFAAKVLEDGTTWMAMLDHRNLLSHTYNPAVFEQAVDAIHQRYLPQPS